MNVSECRKGIMMKLRNVGKVCKEIKGQSISELKTRPLELKANHLHRGEFPSYFRVSVANLP